MRILIVILIALLSFGCTPSNNATPDPQTEVVESESMPHSDTLSCMAEITEFIPAEKYGTTFDIYVVAIAVGGDDCVFVSPQDFTLIGESLIAYPFSTRTFELEKPLEAIDVPAGSIHVGGIIYEVMPGDKPISLSIETLTHSLMIPFEIEEGGLAP